MINLFIGRPKDPTVFEKNRPHIECYDGNQIMKTM